MQNIYDLHGKAFSDVSTYVILEDGQKVATVAFKYPKDGAGRLWCYLHVIGLEMVRACAGGYGYDKASAAFMSAAGAQTLVKKGNYQSQEYFDALMMHTYAIRDCLKDSYSWEHCLRDVGYTVMQAV